MKSSAGRAKAGGTLGTFAGVFTPSILTILGIILFLRLGYVVGAAGLKRALLIIVLANIISVLTSISLSAIATNLRVKGGGDYYLISRTLGVEYGGALGIVLFLAQSVSIAFYAIGFSEAVTAMAGVGGEWTAKIVAIVAVAGLFMLAWLGADWATRFQYVIMALLFAAILAFYLGGLPKWDTAQLRANLDPSSELGFWVIFAIFFPAVTGFTQGVSMSGDLKDPGRSLPRGTFLAVGLSFVIYLSMAVVFAATLPGTDLVQDYGAMGRVSLFAWLVSAGVIAATLSSALASFLGAPRILQSLSGDRVFPFLTFFAAGHGPSGNPRRATAFSGAIAIGTILLGDLNVVAPVVSMFFLISYGLLNYATYFEARAKSPSFRPRFRFFHGRLSLAGALACLGAMLAINPLAGAVAMAVLFALHQYLSRTVPVARWADSERSHRFQRVREDLYAISADLEHPRYWRPVLLAFSGETERRERLLRFSSWLEGGSGFTTAVRFLEGEGPKARRTREEAEAELRAEIEKGGFPAFPRAIVAPHLEAAIPVMLQSHGLGPVRPNTVLVDWFDRPPTTGGPELRRLGSALRVGLRFGCNVVILSATPESFASVAEQRKADRRIDVWHRDNATGRLQLLLAYLMTRKPEWQDARIRLLAVAGKDSSPDQAREELEQMLEDARIAAELEIVPGFDRETFLERSGDASVVFLPFRLGDTGPRCVSDEPLDDVVRGLGICAAVLAAQDITLDAEPEAGKHAEVAEAVDVAAKALKKAEKAAKEAAESAREAAKTSQELAGARDTAETPQEIEKLEEAARQVAQRAEQAKRRAAKARAKAEIAKEEEVKAKTGGTTKKEDTTEEAEA
jgi:amino acid transporter